jgi:hypothetical protein
MRSRTDGLVVGVDDFVLERKCTAVEKTYGDFGIIVGR